MKTCVRFNAVAPDVLRILPDSDGPLWNFYRNSLREACAACAEGRAKATMLRDNYHAGKTRMAAQIMAAAYEIEPKKGGPRWWDRLLP